MGGGGRGVPGRCWFISGSMLNAKEAGARNLLGEKELVKDVSEGRVDLGALKEDELPAALKPLPKSERAKVIRENGEKRREVQGKIQEAF
jgi:hypothetical protein